MDTTLSFKKMHIYLVQNKNTVTPKLLSVDKFSQFH